MPTACRRSGCQSNVNRLLAAREVFLTNSIMGVMPVTRIEQSPVADGRPGEVTRRAMAGLL